MNLDFINDLDTLLKNHKSFCQLQDKLEGKFSDEFIKGMKYTNLKGQILKLYHKHKRDFENFEKQMEEENNVQ